MSSNDDRIKTSAPAAGQKQPPAKPTMGEGSYQATRDYQKSVGDYLRRADVEADAQAARPRSEEEARALQRAENEGRSHAKTGRGGESMDDTPQAPRR